MNRFEKMLGLRGEAKLRYSGGEFHILSPGDYVLCSVSGNKIPLEHLRYWSVERQEAYATAGLSLERYREVMRKNGSN